jgi:hypothetical protein
VAVACAAAARQKQLAEARQACEWLAAGSSPVQQQALRDFDRAVAGFFTGVYRRPCWETALFLGACAAVTALCGVSVAIARDASLPYPWAPVFLAGTASLLSVTPLLPAAMQRVMGRLALAALLVMPVYAVIWVGAWA